MIPTLTLILNLSMVAIMWFGGMQIADHGMPIGDLTAFLTYIVQILLSVLMATIMFVMVPRAAASAERIQAVLDTEPTIVDPPAPARDVPARGRVEFRDVEFRYPGAEEPVLSGITFTAEPGETVAIVGSTGCGKSTLISLIPRFYDVTAGSVLVDGVDVREYALQDLWRRIGLVPQKSFLFSGTVASNLRHGDEEAERRRALAPARDGAGQGVRGRDAGAARGRRSRRAAPASRAGSASAWRSPGRWPSARPINIFDDSFSALDFTTDARLRAALKREMADATVIIVAQRVGTIMHADRIVVLEDGTIAAMGTHDELLETSETYREIVASQLGAEGAA